MFLVTRQVHSNGTRSSERFYLPQRRTDIKKILHQFNYSFNNMFLVTRQVYSYTLKVRSFFIYHNEGLI